MARPRILPDADDLGALRRDGKTYQEIADMYGVTVGAVHVALTRSNLIDNPRARHQEEIPWRVKADHAGSYPAQMLRLAARTRKGEELPPYKKRYLENWLKRLAAQDVVVGYHDEDGFYYTKRRQGVDTGLIRKPQWLIDQETEGVKDLA